ncbi:hypothetical protein [Chamaesiphon sp. OTE_75_metabat_556]|uniref:hypothetical protein n=1 Tax=Chamaesiphon sp. OTE_75_metabat_556 TaxID=2964692 RepID=UPI00286B09B7|nr:hypothetical protein [Chamaesiphon sp. OTE_75_metabat_556]
MDNDKSFNDIKDRVKLTDTTQLYQIKDAAGQVIDFEEASGRQIFNHYRHNMTNYDEVLDTIRTQQGRVTGREEKKAAVGAAEKVIEKYRDEHVKVIQDSQKKGRILKTLLQKAGVATAIALSNKLDLWSEKIKEINKLENSQSTLREWNDTYRVQRELVKSVLTKQDVSQETIDMVNRIYSTRSVNKSIEVGSTLLNLEKSEILKLIKLAIRHKNLGYTKAS